MALKKVRLVWGLPPLGRGRWRLGLFNLQEMPENGGGVAGAPKPKYWKGYLHHALHISVRGLVFWGAGALVAAYFAGAGLLRHRWARGNPQAQVRYMDIVAPWRWDQIDRLRAAGWAAQGRDKVAEGDFVQGFALARLALARDPADLANREQVARLHLAMRLVPRARETLREGLAHGYPSREYLRLAFSLARESDNPAEWVALVERARAAYAALPPDRRSPAEERWLGEQFVHACSAAGRFDDARREVDASLPEGDPLRRELAVLALLGGGNARDAMEVLAAWIEDSPRAPEPRRLLVRAAREAGDHQAMDRAFAGLRALDPAKVDTLFYGIVQNQLAGRHTEALRLYAETMLRHGADAAVHAPLALVLAEAGMDDALGSLGADLRERGLPSEPVDAARLHVAVRGARWEEALRLTEQLRSRGRESRAKDAHLLNLMERLSRACLEDGAAAQSALVDYVAQRPGGLRAYALVIESLVEAGRPRTAARVLTLAEGPYPDALQLGSARSRIEREIAELDRTALLDEPERATNDELASFEAFRTAFGKSAASDPAAALALIARARRANPYWIGRYDARLEEMELPVRAETDDVLPLQLLTRRKLGRGGDAASELLILAERLHASDRREIALLLVREVIRSDPQHALALEKLHRWQPRPPPGAEDAS